MSWFTFPACDDAEGNYSNQSAEEDGCNDSELNPPEKNSETEENLCDKSLI